MSSLCQIKVTHVISDNPDSRLVPSEIIWIVTILFLISNEEQYIDWFKYFGFESNAMCDLFRSVHIIYVFNDWYHEDYLRPRITIDFAHMKDLNVCLHDSRRKRCNDGTGLRWPWNTAKAKIPLSPGRRFPSCTDDLIASPSSLYLSLYDRYTSTIYLPARTCSTSPFVLVPNVTEVSSSY